MEPVRANLLLLVLLALCAIGLVTAQHKARRLVTTLEQEQSRAHSLDVEYGQLQLEQSTYAMHARIERIAGERLKMRTVDATRTIILPIGERK